MRCEKQIISNEESVKNTRKSRGKGREGRDEKENASEGERIE